MLKHSGRIAAGVVVAIGLATAQPASAATGCGGLPVPTRPTVVNGPDAQTTTFGKTTKVAGTATENSSVGVWFRQAFASDYSKRRTLTASCNSTWSTSYVANDDYRIYATAGASQSGTILVQILPTITGAQESEVKKGSTHTIVGTGTPGKTLTVHFHKAGTNDYSIVRTLTIPSSGNWTRPYVASADYRFFVSLPNGQQSPPYLVQAR
jgi:hypothetical protein